MQAPDLTSVERFVREVIPAIPGGLQRITNSTGHLELIRAAAEHRGLTIRTSGRTTYFYDGRWPVGGMTGWVPTLTGREALAISHSKDLTRQMLEAAGVPVPAGITLRSDRFDDALAHLRSAGRPLVLKPDVGKGGSGITSGITSESDLRVAWERAEATGKSSTFVLEEQVEGIDIRAFVVGRRVVAAVTRVNAHVVGDGTSTLAALIDEKQRLRNEHNPRLVDHPIIVDVELLRRCGRALHDVPAEGDVVVLNSLANNAVGGESVDVTDLAHPDLLELAIEAARAIPGLGLAGIDLMTPDLGSAARAAVIEVNVEANIRVHLCPAYGTPRDVAGPIIEEMISTATTAHQARPPRTSSSPSSRSPTAVTDPVERFVRDVLPTVGRFHRVTDTTEHLTLIRRAARKRGLTIRKIGGTPYFYDGRLPVGGMSKWVPTLVGRQALRVSRSKDLTKQMLDAAGVPTPRGIAVGADDFDAALAYLNAAGRPSVLKPVTGYGGAGITGGITTESELRRAWEVATEAAGARPAFVLEEQISGIDIRAFVVGGRVVAAATRLNAHVVGDGAHSIGELVDLKQQLRYENVFLAKRPIVVDADLLASRGHALHDVPAHGEVIVVNRVANQHVGGENVDVTDLIHPDLRQLAVDATRAIPGLGLAGVDLMTPSIDSADGAVVLEVNVRANIRVHHTPAFGTPRDVAGAIIDEMIATATSRSRPRLRSRRPRRRRRLLARRRPR